uniref:T3F20.8 n=1 Tax=Arabidopsis thaliana TaxID=3702 RepID=Q9LPH6_ARATH|nr:T3F20.8 [Arabidopsis thaliana]
MARKASPVLAAVTVVILAVDFNLTRASVHGNV